MKSLSLREPWIFWIDKYDPGVPYHYNTALHTRVNIGKMKLVVTILKLVYFTTYLGNRCQTWQTWRYYNNARAHIFNNKNLCKGGGGVADWTGGRVGVVVVERWSGVSQRINYIVTYKKKKNVCCHFYSVRRLMHGEWTCNKKNK